MIPDRIIEQGTLSTDGRRTSVEVRIPWYRALPGSCIAGATLTVDGVEAPAQSVRWRMEDRDFTFDELSTDTEHWWFPVDSAVLSGEIALSDAAEHTVEVALTLYIPYIIISDSDVLHIEEFDRKTMTVRHDRTEAAA